MIYESCNPEVELKPQAASKDDENFGHYIYRTSHPYVDFYHIRCQALTNYFFSLLNVVIYWAETNLFGGVLLFDRGESGSEVSWH